MAVERAERIVREQPDPHAAGVVETLSDLDGELVARRMHGAQHLTDAEASRRTHEGVPSPAFERTDEEDLDVATRSRGERAAAPG